MAVVVDHLDNAHCYYARSCCIIHRWNDAKHLAYRGVLLPLLQELATHTVQHEQADFLEHLAVAVDPGDDQLQGEVEVVALNFGLLGGNFVQICHLEPDGHCCHPRILQIEGKYVLSFLVDVISRVLFGILFVAVFEHDEVRH